jgi:hypothetical protein
MTLALVDCPTGLAGNMLLAALLDLGVPAAVIEAPLSRLGLAPHYRLRLEERRSGGLRGLHLAVEVLEQQPGHRPWGALRQTLATALEEPLAQRVLSVFSLLAEAEAAVHGQSVDAVHFHEVGAIDSLVDVVGVCAGLLHLGVEQLVCAIPPAGHGVVDTAHGRLPLPAPAVLEIARRQGIPLATSADFPPGELTTPTGLALMACWADRFAPMPAALPRAVGIGLGSRQLDRPNLLRLILAAAAGGPPQAAAGLQAGAESAELLLEQQAQIDDASAEDLAFLAEALRQAGALEVFSQAILMKKGRPGQLITALLPPERAEALRQVWWQHSTSLGVRERLQSRWILPRQQHQLDTPLGVVRVKVALLPDGSRRGKAEHGDLVALARRHNLSLEQVRRQVQQAMDAEP